MSASIVWRDVVVRTSKRTLAKVEQQNFCWDKSTKAAASLSNVTNRRCLSSQQQQPVAVSDPIERNLAVASSPSSVQSHYEGGEQQPTEKLQLQQVDKSELQHEVTRSRLSKSERQRQHQEMLAEHAAQKGRRRRNLLGIQQGHNQGEKASQEEGKELLSLEKHRALRKVLNRHEQQLRKPATAGADQQVKSDPKRTAIIIATSAIPSWLSKTPACFDMTMNVLQSISIGTDSSWTPDILMENFRPLYHQSLDSYRTYLSSGSDENPLPPHLQRALDQLIDAGFGDRTFVNAYQNSILSQIKMDGIRKDVEKKDKVQQQDLKSYKNLKAELQALKEELEQEKQLQKQQDLELQQRSQEASKLVETKEESSPKSIGWSKEIFSYLFDRDDTMDVNSNTAPASSTTTTTTNSPAKKNSFSNKMAISKRIDQLEKAEKKMINRGLEIEKLNQRMEKLRSVSLSMELFPPTHAKVQEVLPDICRGLAEHMKERFGTVIQAYQLLSSQTDLTRPHDWYLYARMNRRKIIFHGGPTNSGKTYTALQRLKLAERGLYLGPLRLLAAEVYDTLTMQGVYCNLLTGQERREVPFSTHSACTIEMASAEKEYDVVVIDEIQMIADEGRGYAWTKALLALRCKEIHVCGGLEAKDIVKKIADACGDEFELHTYQRFSNLHIANTSIAQLPNALGSYKSVQSGDCVVAFSRNDIFAIKREIEQNTAHKCCVIYGSLPPQTRSEQARRFNDPDSGYDVLVASDAIGMGLNLNIRRIIFHTMFKSNGETIVQLDHSSVKQIAGRAGRRNSPYPQGEVTCRDPRDMNHLKKCMSSEILPIEQAGLMPTAAHIELFSAALQAGLREVGKPREVGKHLELHELLHMFNEMAVVQGNYFLCRQRDMQVIAKVLSSYELPLSDKYTICLAPTNANSSMPITTLRNFAQKRMEGAEAGLPLQGFPRRAKSFDDLSHLCSTYAQLELFLWLQNKFNRNALEVQTALARKEATAALINTALREAENLRLNHCYVKRDKGIRQAWLSQNRTRVYSQETVASNSSSNDTTAFDGLDDLLLEDEGSEEEPLSANLAKTELDGLVDEDAAIDNADDLIFNEDNDENV